MKRIRIKISRYFFLMGIIAGILLSCTGLPNKQNAIKDTSSIVLAEINISQIQEAYKTGEFNIEELVQAYLNRIEDIDKHGPQLNSILQINPDAIEIARELDKEYKEGNIRGPMHGIPVLLKDNIDTHDKMATTAGSRALSGSKPLQDSWVAAELRKSGAVILGKTNLSEWANFRAMISSSGWSGEGGQTKNPYKLDRNPCGSSAGSGVAVSANLCVIAIGTETNGSIVCPSTANGIVGIKPTVGLISRTGIIPISFTQDTPGPMARSVEDAVICLGAMTGIDKTDSKTLASEVKSYSDYTQFLKADGLKGKRLGWYKLPSGQHHRVDKLMEETISFLKSEGVEIVEIEKIYDENTANLSFEVMLYEYKDGLNSYLEDLDPATKMKNMEDLIAFNSSDSIELKYFDQQLMEMAQKKGDLNSDEYLNALRTMFEATRDKGIDRIMEEHKLDAFVAPTGSPAWKTDLTNGDNYLVHSSSPAAMAGYPNITVPMGAIDGLPVGISFFGTAWSEPVLIEIAYAFEQGTKKRIVPQFLDK